MKIYTILSYATVFLFSFIVFQIFISTENFVSDIGLNPSSGTSMILRRASVFMIAVVILSFTLRNMPLSEGRQNICLSLSVLFFGLATTGIYEFLHQTVNSSIFVSVIIEIVFGISYLAIFLTNRNKIKS